ncbi:CU044_5270 family protein [Streptomyces sp. NPDC055134]
MDGTRKGLVREKGRGQWATETGPVPGKPGYETSTGYRHLSTLPTDPDAMLRRLRGTAPEHSGQRADQAMLVLVGDLIRDALVLPEVGAALYRAAARIPGVTVVKGVKDAAGRPGIAVARKDPDNPSRDEWIFDVKTHEFLGERTVATEAWSGGVKKGQVTSNTAVVDRGVWCARLWCCRRLPTLRIDALLCLLRLAAARTRCRGARPPGGRRECEDRP